MQSKSIIFLMLTMVVYLSSCVKDDPIIPNEEEVITTLTYTLTPDNSGDPVIFSFQDLDGDGGNAPIITNGVLMANTNYVGSLELLNETEDPAEVITAEIQTEAEEHQFFFQTSLNDLVMAYLDQDANGNPIGLSTSVMTGNAETGTLTIILKHEPNKSADGVTDGDVTNAGGETDLEVTFQVDVQ